MELKGLKKLIIHIDIANITPELHSAEELSTYFSALDAISRVILARRPTLPEKYAYFEGSFLNPEPKNQHNLISEKLPALLFRFKGVFDRLPNIKEYQKSLPYVILDMFRLRGYQTLVSPKEAEQMIPDEIMKSHEDSIHAIVSDDKARDTTRCKIRVVHSRQRAYAVRSLGVAEKVLSLEELAERNYLICWLYRKIKFADPNDCLSLKNIPQIIGEASFSEVDLSEDFENFTTNDLRRLVLHLISSDEKRIGKFLNVGDNYARFGKFLETVINRLCSEQHLLMYLWGKLRLYSDIETVMTVNDLDYYFMRCIVNDQTDYIRLEHELEEKEINLRQIMRIKGTEENIRSKIGEVQKRIDEINALETELNEKREELKREEKREGKLREDLLKVEQKLRKCKTKIQKKTEKIEQIESEIKLAEIEIDKKESQIRELENIKSKVNQKIKELGEQNKQLTSEIKELNNQINEKKKTFTELSEMREKLESQIKTYESEIEKIEEFLRDSDDTVKTLNERFERLNQEKRLKEKEIEDKKSQVKTKEDELEKVKAEYENLLSKEDQIREEYRKLQKFDELKALQEKVEAFKRTVGEYEKVMNIDEKFESIRKELERLKSRLTELLKESL